MSNNQQYTVNHSDVDAAVFTLPGEHPGGEEPFEVQPDTTDHWRWYVHIDNGWNESADFTVEGSHFQDPSDFGPFDLLDAPAEDGSPITVAAGAVDFIDGTTGHSYIQLTVDPAADPSSGDLIVTIQRRKP